MAACTCTEAANFFSTRPRTATKAERSSFYKISSSGKGPSTQLSLLRLISGIFITRRANLGDFSGIVVHTDRVFCTKGDGSPHSSLVHSILPPVDSSNTHRSLQTIRRSRRSPSASIALFQYLRIMFHTSQCWRYYQSADPGNEPAFEPISTSVTSTPRSPSVAPIYTQHFPPTLYE